MESAKDFFNNLDLSSTKCNYLAKNYEQSLEWEKESVSTYSIGIVEDNENLARNIFSPIHFDKETASINSLAFNDIFDKGLSVLRLNYIDYEQVVSIGVEKVKNDLKNGKVDRQYKGYIFVEASKIRDCIFDFKRAMAIYDTALSNISSHADMCNISVTKGNRNLLRIFLRDTFSKLIPVP